MAREAAAVAAIKKNSCLHTLTAAALALPGMSPNKAAAGVPADAVSTGFRYSHYDECCNRMAVHVFQAFGITPLGESAELSASWVTDRIAGASPVLNIPFGRTDAVAGASGGAAKVSVAENAASLPLSIAARPVQVMSSATIRDTRNALDLSGQYYLNDVTIGLAGGASDEKDYRSYFSNLNLRWELNRKMTTLAFGAGFTHDKIMPTTRDIKERKTAIDSLLGITQILDKNSLLQANLTYLYSSGFLSNPYKKVFISGGGRRQPGLESAGPADIFWENRPNERHQWAVLARYLRYFSDWDAALHLDYRFHIDDWSSHSHTIEAQWHQPLGGEWMLVPSLRYYSQSEVDFYSPYFAAPRSNGFYSSDYRLSGFGALSGGLKFTKAFFDQLNVHAGVEYAVHKAGLKLDGATQSGFADFSFFLISAGINYRF